VLGYFTRRGCERPPLFLKVRELQTALGLVLPAREGSGPWFRPSARRLGRDDVAFVDLDETGMIAPVVMCNLLERKVRRNSPSSGS